MNYGDAASRGLSRARQPDPLLARGTPSSPEPPCRPRRRIVMDLQQAGLLQVQGRKITIPDPGRLAVG